MVNANSGSSLFLLLGFLALLSCNTQRSNKQEVATADSAAVVKEVALSEDHQSKAAANFATYCAGCHGENATTFADRKWKFGENREDLFASIKFGHPDAGMPAFEKTFSDEEIQGLVSYIKEGMQRVAQYSFETTESIPSTFKAEAFSYKLDTVAIGFGEVPWGMAFLPDGGMLLTEIGGTLYRQSADGKLQKVKGTPKVLAEGQGGLLDVVLHPDFNRNNVIYLSYSAVREQGGQTQSTTAIMRAKLDGNALSQQKVIFEALPWATTRHHYGSRMAFGPDGNLYFSVGDRGNREENPQSLERHPGKIHRIKDDGSIPADNPFSAKSDAQASIFAYGNRNPQGMTFHPQTGVLWENEHGPRGGDEINIIEKGTNYGWSTVSYGINYDGTTFTKQTVGEGIQEPVMQWTPSIAPSGLAIVTGNRYKGWEGSLLSGSLRYKYLNRSELEGKKVGKEEALLKNIGRVRNVKMSPDDYIYIAVENPARIYRLVPLD